MNTGKTVKIRVADAQDAAALYELNELFNGQGCTDLAALAASLAGNPQETVLIACCGDEAVGFICGQLFMSMCYRDYYAEITELFVREEYRRLGIARRLMESLEELYVKKHNIRSFQLFTGADNDGAQRFYEEAGYNKSPDILYRKRL